MNTAMAALTVTVVDAETGAVLAHETGVAADAADKTIQAVYRQHRCQAAMIARVELILDDTVLEW